MEITTILFISLAFVSAVFSGIVGFGAALIMLSLGSFLLDYKILVGVVTVYFLANNIFKIFLFWRRINWKIFGLVIAGSLPLAIAGAFLLVEVPSEILKRILGIVVLFYVVNRQFGLFKNYRPKIYQIPMIGAVYGFFSGIVGVGDPVKAALLNQLGIVKESFIGTMAMIAFVQNLFKIPIYFKSNLVTINDWQMILALIIVSFAGIFIGKQVVKKVSPELFGKLVLLILAIMSVKLIIWA